MIYAKVRSCRIGLNELQWLKEFQTSYLFSIFTWPFWLISYANLEPSQCHYRDMVTLSSSLPQFSIQIESKENKQKETIEPVQV